MSKMVNTKVKNRKNKYKISSAIIYIILGIWATTTIFPFVWVINNSFKPSSEVLNSSFSLPTDFNLDNYKNAYDNLNILEAYKNSLIISVSVTFFAMLIASMMAFGIVRYDFKGKEFVKSLIYASLMFPVFATIIPVFKMMSQLSLLNKSISVILPQIAGNLSFATVVLMGFLNDLPIDMEEAAFMEGASIRQVFTKIVIPLIKPALSTVGIFCFLWSYNDLFTQLIMIRRRTKFPISALLNEISSKYGTDYGLMAASIAIIIVPVLIVYVLFQKNIIKGMTAGALKG